MKYFLTNILFFSVSFSVLLAQNPLPYKPNNQPNADLRFDQWNPNFHSTFNRTNNPDEAKRFTTIGWPGQQFIIDNVKVKENSELFLLGYESPLEWRQSGKQVEIQIPDALMDISTRPWKLAYAFRIQGVRVD